MIPNKVALTTFCILAFTGTVARVEAREIERCMTDYGRQPNTAWDKDTISSGVICKCPDDKTKMYESSVVLDQGSNAETYNKIYVCRGGAIPPETKTIIKAPPQDCRAVTDSARARFIEKNRVYNAADIKAQCSLIQSMNLELQNYRNIVRSETCNGWIVDGQESYIAKYINEFMLEENCCRKTRSARNGNICEGIESFEDHATIVISKNPGDKESVGWAFESPNNVDAYRAADKACQEHGGVDCHMAAEAANGTCLTLATHPFGSDRLYKTGFGINKWSSEQSALASCNGCKILWTYCTRVPQKR